MTTDGAAVSRAKLADARRHLDLTLRQGGEFWVYAYASLLWRPEFAPDELRPAQIWGYHRALRMRSTINRGSPECPGLVFTLLPGGSCTGQVHRVPAEQAVSTLESLWVREMPNGVYDARWLACRTPSGPVRALAFTLPAHSPSHTGALDDATHLHIFRQACGRYGHTIDYLMRTADRLRELGIRDAEVSRLVRLAERHGLV